MTSKEHLDDLIVEMRRKGCKRKWIARELGCSISKVRKVLAQKSPDQIRKIKRSQKISLSKDEKFLTNARLIDLYIPRTILSD